MLDLRSYSAEQRFLERRRRVRKLQEEEKKRRRLVASEMENF